MAEQVDLEMHRKRAADARAAVDSQIVPEYWMIKYAQDVPALCDELEATRRVVEAMRPLVEAAVRYVTDDEITTEWADLYGAVIEFQRASEEGIV